ncbi:MAG: sulfatase-like hydrolase/transferase [Verrucomicrobiales bacterium]|nr:sulfatase-like hydrolase/transferase [Verrucomicrobiales bacterium]
MNPLKSILLAGIAFTLSVSFSLANERPEKPNVVLILTDDLGWQDVKCYDIDEPSPMETPNIDAFAKKGVMFWQGYSPAPTCAPSRCAILSGNHPARAQKTHVVGGAPPAPHNKHSLMMDPWYSGRMPEDEFTIAKALSQNGYVTGHSGKWHIAIDHNAFPQPKDVGFDFTRSTRGSRSGMTDRLKGFATDKADDPFRLDENGYPYHQTNEDALDFLRENKDKPFFLYYATWLVHAPIHTRSKERLEKYAKRLGIDPAKTPTKDTPGQLNPFYCAMVEELDYYIGMVFDYLDETEDPRWPGHKLSENTYVIFTSDNGGMEGGPKERYTDNEPLARGKISAMEGGTRVPLLIAGPGIPQEIQTNVMANGLDFYPTILSMTGTPFPSDKNLDGCDLLPLLKTDPTNADLVKNPDGSVRKTMMWHFPHGGALESTIRNAEYKLVKNYNHVNNPAEAPLELFHLYDASSQRVDIEEAKNLIEEKPEVASELNQQLTDNLTEMDASLPYYNPNTTGDLPGKDKTCVVTSHKKEGNTVTFTYEDRGAKVIHADLIYSLNGGARYEEWFKKPATVNSDRTVTALLPKNTTHYYINLIDENRFLRSYPEVQKSDKKSYSKSALSVTDTTPRPVTHKKPKKNDFNRPFTRWDLDKDEYLTFEEYQTGQAGGEKLEERFKRLDKDGDGKVSRKEFVDR